MKQTTEPALQSSNLRSDAIGHPALLPHLNRMRYVLSFSYTVKQLTARTPTSCCALQQRCRHPQRRPATHPSFLSDWELKNSHTGTRALPSSCSHRNQMQDLVLPAQNTHTMESKCKEGAANETGAHLGGLASDGDFPI